jgi:dihydroorotate dehydrogenase
MDLTRLTGAFLRKLPPERAHDLALAAIRRGLGQPETAGDDPRLAVTAFGRRLSNPLGLAAGFDKDAEAVEGLFGLGFGFLEVGTVTPRPQGGNPKPRVFRLPEDRAIVNRLGFNSAGLDAMDEQLGRYRRTGGRGVLGINLGANRDSADPAADYEAGLRRMARYADYLAVNVSSPNTPGLRALQGRDQLAALVERLLAVRSEVLKDRPPALLVKIAPDLSEQDRADIAEVALAHKLDGLIVANTTTERPAGLQGKHAGETGGLSGAPLFEPSTALLADMARRTEGKMTLIGVGGISTGRQAYAKLRAGATLVQLYTALIYDGPEAVLRIKAELAEALAADGFAEAGDAIGCDVARS